MTTTISEVYSKIKDEPWFRSIAKIERNQTEKIIIYVTVTPKSFQSFLSEWEHTEFMIKEMSGKEIIIKTT